MHQHITLLDKAVDGHPPADSDINIYIILAVAVVVIVALVLIINAVKKNKKKR